MANIAVAQTQPAGSQPEIGVESPVDPAVTSSVRPNQPVIQRTERARRAVAARIRQPVPESRNTSRTASQKVKDTTYASGAVPDGIRIRQIPGTVAQLGGTEKRIRIVGIAVENAPPAVSRAVDELTGVMTNKPVGVGDLFASADFVQKALHAKSLTLAVVTVPDQVVRDGGQLLLRVVTPSYAGLDLGGVPERLRRTVEARLGKLIGTGASFDHAAFDNALLLLQEQTGLTFRASTVARGSDSFIAISTNERWASAEQSFSAGMGFPAKWLTSLSTATIHSPLGLGERLYASGNLGQRDEFRLYRGPAHWGLVGINMPIAETGLTLDVSYNRFFDRRRIRGPFEDFFGTRTSRLLAKLEYPVIMSRQNKLIVRAGLDGTRQSQFLIVEPEPKFDLWREETRAARLGIDWQLILDNQFQIEVHAEASQGLKGLGAGSTLNAYPWSQAGAKASFQKLEARIKARMPLGNDFILEASGRAQTSFGQALPSIEQISLLSYGNIRSLNIVTSAGDTGAFGQLELSRNFGLGEVSPRLAGWGMEPYAAAAIGMVRLVNKPAVQDSHIVSGHRLSTGIKFLAPLQDNIRPSELQIEGAFIRSNEQTQRQRSLSVTWLVRF